MCSALCSVGRQETTANEGKQLDECDVSVAASCHAVTSVQCGVTWRDPSLLIFAPTVQSVACGGLERGVDVPCNDPSAALRIGWCSGV